MSAAQRGASEPCGTVAYQQCVNPACLAEEGDRHYSDCSPVTPSRTSDMTPDQAASLARALLAHTCDECAPPMIVCDDPACEPYGEHYRQQHATTQSAPEGMQRHFEDEHNGYCACGSPWPCGALSGRRAAGSGPVTTEGASEALDALLARREAEHARHYPMHQDWLAAGDERGDPFVSSCACCCSVCEEIDDEATPQSAPKGADQ